MRSSILTLALICAGCAPAGEREQGDPKSRSASGERASDTTTIEIRRPTLLAHFPITQADVDSSADAGEALSDFQHHLDGARDSLTKLGIMVVERYAPAVSYRLGDRVIRFAPPSDSGVAYVFVAPDRPTRVYYGVVTDSDLLELTNRFLVARPDP